MPVCRASPSTRDRDHDPIAVEVHVLVDPQPHVGEDFHLVGDETHDPVVAAPLALGERLFRLKHDPGSHVSSTTRRHGVISPVRYVSFTAATAVVAISTFSCD